MGSCGHNHMVWIVLVHGSLVGFIKFVCFCFVLLTVCVCVFGTHTLLSHSREGLAQVGFGSQCFLFQGEQKYLFSGNSQHLAAQGRRMEPSQKYINKYRCSSRTLTESSKTACTYGELLYQVPSG